MDMELSLVMRILWRWKWLILSCMATAGVAVWLGISNTIPTYESKALLQFSTPERLDVELIEQYSFVSERDEIVQSINNFISAAQQGVVYERTRNALILDDKTADYRMNVKAVADTDYVELSVESESPFLAESIVNEHVSFSITHYGELRARPANSTRMMFAERLSAAEVELKDVEDAFNEFRSENGITFLETETNLNESMLVELQAEQSRLIARDPVGQSPQVAQLEVRIATHRANLDSLAQLEPQYIRLQLKLDALREKSQLLSAKVAEAELKQEIAKQTSFIQIAAPALVPTEPIDRSTRLIILALMGSLGLGVLLAFLLEYATGSPLAKESKIVQEVRSILTDEQLLSTKALARRIQHRKAEQGDSFDLRNLEEQDRVVREREIELRRRQKDSKQAAV
ncbi:MAG: hypothetical protein AAF702_30625 [Chloroflexota bacterium]